jgi:RimJ/RimL family protein N-acetyltransferase
VKGFEKDRRRLARLFEAYPWNHLPDAILDGTTGQALADDEDNPQVAVLEAPSLKLSIVGGDAGHPSAREYIEGLSPPKALICASAGWEALLRQVHRGKLLRLPRYAFTSENLDRAHLRQLGSRIPDGYRLERMDLNLAQQLAGEKSEFASDHMLSFDSPEDFIARGFGFCLREGDEIVSVATTFVICEKGIEIQINTREEHQGKGLATVVAAQLIVHSLETDLDPNWDAENERSVGLAKKLGYTPQGTYSIFVVVRSRAVAALAGVALKVKRLLKL